MACRTCTSFDPKYHGGFCNYFGFDTSPYDSCSRGGTYTCASCIYFKFSYSGHGYCKYYNTYTSDNSSSCNKYH